MFFIEAIKYLNDYSLYYKKERNGKIIEDFDKDKFEEAKQELSMEEELVTRIAGEKYSYKDPLDALIGHKFLKEVTEGIEDGLKKNKRKELAFGEVISETRENYDKTFIDAFFRGTDFNANKQEFYNLYKVFLSNGKGYDKEVSEAEDKLLNTSYDLLSQDIKGFTGSKFIDLYLEFRDVAHEYNDKFFSHKFFKALKAEFNDRIEENKKYFDFVNDKLRGKNEMLNEVLSDMNYYRREDKPFDETDRIIKHEQVEIMKDEMNRYKQTGKGSLKDFFASVTTVTSLLSFANGLPALTLLSVSATAKLLYDSLNERDSKGDFERLSFLFKNVKHYLNGERNSELFSGILSIEEDNAAIRECLTRHGLNPSEIRTSLDETRHKYGNMYIDYKLNEENIDYEKMLNDLIKTNSAELPSEMIEEFKQKNTEKDRYL